MAISIKYGSLILNTSALMEVFQRSTVWSQGSSLQVKIIRLFEDELLVFKQPPFDTGSRSLFIAFYAPAEFSCFLELGWEFPSNTVDLYAEYRLLRCGMGGEKAFSLVGALRHFNLDRFIPEEKHQWRELAIRGVLTRKRSEKALPDYCQEDVDATCKI